MKIDYILSMFAPKDGKFFPLLEETSTALKSASDGLVELFEREDPKEIPDIYKKIKSAELAGDKVTSKIHKELCSSFITPFDREDVDALADEMDGCIDGINRIAQKVLLYEPKRKLYFAPQMAKIISDGSAEISGAIKDLKTMKSSDGKLRKHYKEIKRLEESADLVYEKTISEIFHSESDPIELIKQKEILHELEKTVNRINKVGKTLKTIYVKYA